MLWFRIWRKEDNDSENRQYYTPAKYSEVTKEQLTSMNKPKNSGSVFPVLNARHIAHLHQQAVLWNCMVGRSVGLRLAQPKACSCTPIKCFY